MYLKQFIVIPYVRKNMRNDAKYTPVIRVLSFEAVCNATIQYNAFKVILWFWKKKNVLVSQIRAVLVAREPYEKYMS